MPASVTGIELVAFAILVAGALGLIGLLFAAFLTGEQPPTEPAELGIREPGSSERTAPDRALDAPAET
jgi:hypothetical protein